ncbi:TetR/AcrR family transcriptional regulator [Streptomyces ferrugineus]|uniref:TetR/AcrR family transcriptional regulator n=1 Tax=Streptomyces ferrugineus TaxID=1413221 RepID=A0A7M2SBL3_9ACTN|nr:TetR family transcriptional regulator [Streptomyces ferrugineus]QOV33135.1 TetR/AcrR family transcriptional regulator [Streptomyces ferrugineus]
MRTSPNAESPRREELLDRLLDHVITHGVDDLSLRKLAAAVGVAPNALQYHFGPREDMVAAILARHAERIRATIEAEGDAASQVHRAWEQLTDPSVRKSWHAFFEFYALALRNPDRYRAFLDHVARDWSDPLTRKFVTAGVAPEEAAARAALLVAAVRGLVLDRLADGDEARVSAALDLLIDLLESWARPH